MAERIDYVRVAFRGEVREALEWKARFEAIVETFTTPRKMMFKQVAHFDRYYDNSAKQWVDTFESWGEAADYIVQELPVEDRANVLRYDYRMGFDKLAVRMSTIAHVVRANKGRTRRTVTQIDSPPRIKKGDRDAGGDFFAVGSKGSERRTALYKRGNEQWALEVQFGKGMPIKMHQEAVDLYLNTEGFTYYDALMKVLYMHFSEAVQDHLHYTVEMITGEMPVEEQHSAFNVQESFLAGFNLNWEQMDNDARLVVAEKVCTWQAERAIIVDEELIEPEGLWDEFSMS